MIFLPLVGAHVSLDEQDLNIVYVLDSSSTISDNEWNTFKESVANIVDFTFAGNDVRYSSFIFLQKIYIKVSGPALSVLWREFLISLNLCLVR